MSGDLRPIVLTLMVSDDIAPNPDTITRESYERLVAAAERAGLSIPEALDELITRTLPRPDGSSDDD